MISDVFYLLSKNYVVTEGAEGARGRVDASTGFVPPAGDSTPPISSQIDWAVSHVYTYYKRVYRSYVACFRFFVACSHPYTWCHVSINVHSLAQIMCVFLAAGADYGAEAA